MGLRALRNNPRGRRRPAENENRSDQINVILKEPKTKARLTELDGSVLSASPANFGKLIAAKTEKWGKVIRAANIKAE